MGRTPRSSTPKVSTTSAKDKKNEVKAVKAEPIEVSIAVKTALHKPDIKSITSISDLLKFLAEDIPKNGNPYWFRGHSNCAYELVPGYYRSKLKHHESHYIERFKQNASMLERGQVNDMDWLFVMQHYGVPTRLLDWSESALVALYFACITNKDKNGELFVLSPIDLNKAAGIHGEHIVSINDEQAKNYRPDAFKFELMTKMNPIAIICPRNTTRMQAQLGTFTIFHREDTPIDKMKKDIVWSYIIDRDAKTTILQELNLLGLTHFSVFPELSSIGQMLKETK